MQPYENFSLAAYVYAYYLDGKTEEQIQADIDTFRSMAPLHKAYLETHRALVDIPDEQMLMAKRVFERNGIQVSGGITTTGKVGERKPAIFDCYCYSSCFVKGVLSVFQTTRITVLEVFAVPCFPPTPNNIKRKSRSAPSVK